jgi:hypothetical protein
MNGRLASVRILREHDTSPRASDRGGAGLRRTGADAYRDGERKARQIAEHASQLKDEVVATLSHELRTGSGPLTLRVPGRTASRNPSPARPVLVTSCARGADDGDQPNAALLI